MHEHDTDLIMALAEGSLSGADATRAEATIAACSVCTADLSMQRTALSALAEAPRVYLSAAESHRMRQAVKKELRIIDPEAAPAPKRRRFSLGALAGAAAVLLAVVVAAPTLNLLGGGSDDSPAFNDALSPPAPVVDQQSPELDTNLPSAAPAPLPPNAAEDVDGEFSFDAPPEEALAARAELPTLKSDTNLEALRQLFIDNGGELPLEALTDGGFVVAYELGAVPPEPEPVPVPQPDATPDDDPVVPAAGTDGPRCDLESVPVPAERSTAMLIGLLEFEGTPALVVAFVGDSIQDTQIAVLDASTCEVLAAA
jgi:hypothetical protein